MHSRTLTAASSAAMVLSLLAPAYAQENTDKRLETPIRALEFYGLTGYTQGFGSLQSGVDMRRLIAPGFATELGGGYRFDPHWAFTLFGQYAEFDAQRATNARGLVVGAAGAYHFLPYRRFDPWVQLGAGYRFLWETDVTPGTNVTTDGLELAKLSVGVDYRASRDISFAPVIGVDLTLPLFQSVGGSSAAITDPRVSAFVFAGLQARFDLTSTFAGGPRPVSTTIITQATECIDR